MLSSHPLLYFLNPAVQFITTVSGGAIAEPGYNDDHRHCIIGMITPAMVHCGLLGTRSPTETSIDVR
jgi:hypothetical protein